MNKFSKRMRSTLSLLLSIIMILTLFHGLPMSSTAIGNTEIINLTVNYQINQLAIDKDQIRFGWQMDSDIIGQYQKDYQIVVTEKTPDGPIVWDSNIVTSGLAQGIAYGGDDLDFETRYYWTVKVTDMFGQVLASAPAYFETGTDFAGAQWISPIKGTGTFNHANPDPAKDAGNTYDVTVQDTGGTQDQIRNAELMRLWGFSGVGRSNWNNQQYYVKLGGNPLIRTEAALSAGKTVAAATLYMTSLGDYNPYINGEKVFIADTLGDMVEPTMAPGTTDYRLFTNYQAYDVTNLVQRDASTGKVAIGAEMYKGYYAGNVSVNGRNTDGVSPFGPGSSSLMGLPVENTTNISRTLCLLGRLVITYTDGSKQVVNTNTDNWKSIAGPVIFNDTYHGEFRDGDREKALRGWSSVGFNDAAWYEMKEYLTQKDYPGELRPNNSAVPLFATKYDLKPTNKNNETFLFKATVTGNLDPVPTEPVALENVPGRPALSRGTMTQYPVALDQPIILNRTTNTTANPTDILIVDFGQNHSGVVQLDMSGTPGAVVRVRHAEMLADGTDTGTSSEWATSLARRKGMLYYGNLRNQDAQVSFYKLDDTGALQTWLPNSVYNGYRYVEITVITDNSSVTLHDITSKVITSARNETGSIETNDPLVNRLARNSFWGQMSNFMGIPTDCNQRNERVGWTGDIMVFGRTATTNFDSASFLDNYVQILMAESKRNTGVNQNTRSFSNVAPAGNFNVSQNGDATLHGGWSDVGIILPWTLYTQTGDTNHITRNYAQMDLYMDSIYGGGPNGNGTASYRVYATSNVSRNIQRLNTYHLTAYGDHLTPGGAHITIVNFLYQIYTTVLMRDMAEVVGDTAMFDKYSDRYEELKAFFSTPPVVQNESVDPSSRLGSNGYNPLGRVRTGGGFVYDAATAAAFGQEDGDLMTYGPASGSNVPVCEENAQTGLVWALRLGLYRDEAHKQHLIEKLHENILNENQKINPNRDENTMSVGFLGVAAILPVTTDVGYPQTAYNLLLQDSMPSWMLSVKNGATTTWERWNSYTAEAGFGPSGMNSYNHFAYGCVNEWMYHYMVGIKHVDKNPGFKEIILQPTIDPSGRIKDVKGSYNSAYGNIVSNWQYDGSDFDYQCTVPANTTATLYLPSMGASTIMANGVPVNEAEGVETVGPTTHNGIAVVELKLTSGSFEFTSETKTTFKLADLTKTEYEVNEPFWVVVTTGADATKVKIVNEKGATIGQIAKEVTDNGDGTKTFRIQTMIGSKGDRTLTAMVMGQIGDYKDVGASLDVTINPATPIPEINDDIISATALGTSVVNTPFTVTVVTDKSITKVKIVSETGSSIGTLSSSVVTSGEIKTWTISIKVGTKGNRTFTALGSESTGGYGTDGKSFDIKIT